MMATNKENQNLTPETAEKLISMLSGKTQVNPLEIAKKPVIHIQNSQIIAGILGTTGLVIFALGIENMINNIPQLGSPLIEIVLGLVLLSISGLFLKKLS